MRIRTLAIRILNQLRHDKRTVALVLIAPLLILSLIYFILDTGNTTYKIGIIDAPDSFISQLQETEDATVKITHLSSKEAADAMKKETITAAVTVSHDLEQISIHMDGTNTATAKKVEALIRGADAAALQDKIQQQADSIKKDIEDMKDNLTQLPIRVDVPDVDLNMAEPDIQLNYVYGSEDSTSFDNFGAPLVGLLVFFFVFLISGIHFLSERTSGTLEKMLSTPVRRYEIITGYVLGFSTLALVQTVLVTVFVVYVLKLAVVGSIWYVVLINLLTAMTALTLGMLLSTLARSEFQMIQFIPLVILPQVFLCGLFDLSDGWQMVSYFMPLTYTADGLSEVILKGSGFQAIWLDCLVLLGCTLLFMFINIRLLRRQRAI